MFHLPISPLWVDILSVQDTFLCTDNNVYCIIDLVEAFTAPIMRCSSGEGDFCFFGLLNELIDEQLP